MNNIGPNVDPAGRHTGTKREELGTYKALGLESAARTRAQRARLEKGGIYVVLGGGRSGRPALKVLATRAREVRLEVMKAQLERARAAGIQLDPERILESMRGQLEAEVYDRLAAEADLERQTEAAFLRLQGRRPTRDEKRQVRQMQASAPAASSPGREQPQRPNQRGLIEYVLGRVQGRQWKNPVKLRTAWAETVGADIAQQSELVRIDDAQAVAYFRCANSVLSHHLQRQPQLAAKLGRVLGVAIRQMRVMHG